MRKNRKGIVLAASILGSVAIISTGFASWVITSTQAAQSEAGNIEVDTVVDKSFKITYGWTEGANTKKIEIYKDDPSVAENLIVGEDAIRYGAVREGLVAGKTEWLGADSNSEFGGEYLYVKLYFTCEFVGITQDKTEVTVTVAEKTKNTTDYTTTYYKNAQDAGYVGSLPSGTFNYSAPESGKTTSMGTVTLQFTWGSFFNNVNPYMFFNNEHTADEEWTNSENQTYAATTYSALAKEVLTGTTFQDLAKAKYVVTVTPTVKDN